MHLPRFAPVCCLCLLWSSPQFGSARAQGAVPKDARWTHAIGADYGPLLYLSPGLPFSAGGASLYYRGRARVGVTLSGGARFLHVDRIAGGFAFEGFVGVQLAPHVGPWRPLAGIELGGTTLVSESLRTEPDYTPEEYTPRLHPLGPVYVGLVAAPLRFAVGHFLFQVGGLQIATHLPQLGSALRLQISYAQLEWSF